MKAILVVDIPNELDVNDLLIDYCVHTKGEYKPIRKGGNYSIKPVHALKCAGRDYIIYERQYLYKNLEREFDLLAKVREFDESNSNTK